MKKLRDLFSSRTAEKRNTAYSISDSMSWKQYIPEFDPGCTMGIKNTSYQNYELVNPSGPVVELSMVTIYELAVLYMLAKDYYTGEGEILDLGSLLGVTTNALARGLNDNAKVAVKHKRIHAFDLFLSRDMGLAIPEPSETGSVFDRFLRNNMDWLDYISISPGNLLEMTWNKSKIEVLFIDIAKTWDLNNFVVNKLFRYLIPLKSIIIQQDYVHFHEYWIHITMEYLSEYFDLLYMVYGSSAVYFYKSRIPNSVLYTNLKDLSLKEKIYYLERAREKAFPAVQQVMKCAQAYCLIEHECYTDAERVLQSIDFNTPRIEDPTLDFSNIVSSNANIVNDILKQRCGRRAITVKQTNSLFDTDQRENLLGELEVVFDKTEISTEESFIGHVKVKNIGTTVWQLGQKEVGIVNLGVGIVNLGSHLLSEDGKQVLERDFSRHQLISAGSKVKPGDSLSFPINLQSPPYGKYILEFDLVAEMITWFEQNGSSTVRIPISVV